MIVMDRPTFPEELQAQFGVEKPVVVDLVRRATGVAIGDVRRIIRGDENEVYRVQLVDGSAVYPRIARPSAGTSKLEVWAMERARCAGVPVPEVLHVEVIDVGEGGQLVTVIAEARAPAGWPPRLAECGSEARRGPSPGPPAQRFDARSLEAGSDRRLAGRDPAPLHRRPGDLDRGRTHRRRGRPGRRADRNPTTPSRSGGSRALPRRRLPRARLRRRRPARVGAHRLGPVARCLGDGGPGRRRHTQPAERSGRHRRRAWDRLARRPRLPERTGGRRHQSCDRTSRLAGQRRYLPDAIDP